MNMDIREEIINIIASVSKVENIKEILLQQSDLTKLGIDSIEFIGVIVAIEDKFMIEFEDEALNQTLFESLITLFEYVEKRYMLINQTQV